MIPTLANTQSTMAAQKPARTPITASILSMMKSLSAYYYDSAKDETRQTAQVVKGNGIDSDFVPNIESDVYQWATDAWAIRIKPKDFDQLQSINCAIGFHGLETDWALFEIPEDVPPRVWCDLLMNRIGGLQITGIYEHPPGVSVPVTIALPHGEISGQLRSGSVLHRIGAKVFNLRLVTVGHPLPVGCSGAWVAYQGQLCGVLVAVRPNLPWIYIMTFDQVKSEMEDVCSLSVRFPLSENSGHRNYELGSSDMAPEAVSTLEYQDSKKFPSQAVAATQYPVFPLGTIATEILCEPARSTADITLNDISRDPEADRPPSLLSPQESDSSLEHNSAATGEIPGISVYRTHSSVESYATEQFPATFSPQRSRDDNDNLASTNKDQSTVKREKRRNSRPSFELQDELVMSIDQLVEMRRIEEKDAEIKEWLARTTDRDEDPVETSQSQEIKVDAMGLLGHEENKSDDGFAVASVSSTGSRAESSPVALETLQEPRAILGNFTFENEDISGDEPSSPRQELHRVHPWQDFVRAPITTTSNQPSSSSAAIFRFNQETARWETASRAATWGSQRRLSESELGSIVDGSRVRHLSLAKKSRERGSWLLEKGRSLIPRRDTMLLKDEMYDTEYKVWNQLERASSVETEQPMWRTEFVGSGSPVLFETMLARPPKADSLSSRDLTWASTAQSPTERSSHYLKTQSAQTTPSIQELTLPSKPQKENGKDDCSWP